MELIALTITLGSIAISLSILSFHALFKKGKNCRNDRNNSCENKQKSGEGF